MPGEKGEKLPTEPTDKHPRKTSVDCICLCQKKLHYHQEFFPPHK